MVRLQVESRESFSSKIVRQKSQTHYKLDVVWLDITRQLYVLLPAFWTIVGVFSFIFLAGLRLTVVLIFLPPLHIWEGVQDTLPNWDMWGKGGERACNGPVEKVDNSELSPGCQQNGKCYSIDWGLCTSLRIRGYV